MNKKHIILIGFMGTGKSTVSRELKNLLALPEIDTDVWIEKEEGRAIKDIFEQSGEEYFRNLETDLAMRLTEMPASIVSCGGGMVIRKENADYLKQSGTVIWLTAKPETILERIKEFHTRPLLEGNMNSEYISTLLDARMKYYQYACENIVSTDGKKAKDIAIEIKKIVEK